MFDPLRYEATLPVFDLTGRAGEGNAPLIDFPMQNLVAFRGLSAAARMDWDDMVARRTQTAPAGIGAAIGLPSKADNHALHLGRYATRLQFWRRAAFGLGYAEADVNRSDRIVRFPWCLTDREFSACDAQLRDGRMPRLSGVAEDWEKQPEWYGEVAGTIGGVVGAFMPGGIGKTLIGVAKWTGVGAVVGSAVGYAAEPLNQRFLIDLYAKDKVRRDIIEL